MSNQPKAGVRIVVVGTGTEVGKTHVTTALVRAAVRAGLQAVGLKPVESGVGTGISDASRLGAASLFHVKQPPYAFPDPVSPHLAAERAGRRVDFGRILRWVNGHDAEVSFVETAGALLSPLDLRRTNLDLTIALAPTVVLLVAADRLGVLHDVRATLGPLRAALPTVPVALALSAPRRPDSSTGTNARELVRLGLARKPQQFPRARLVSRETTDAARALLARLLPPPLRRRLPP